MDTAVGLVQAYLHLNGYLVLTEVPVQMRAGRQFFTATDLDILAMRFPHEPEHHPHETSNWEEFFTGADPILDLSNDTLDFIIAEVKEGESHANPALRRQATIHFALRRLGCCDVRDLDNVAREVSRRGEVKLQVAGGSHARIRLVIFGGTGDMDDEGILEIPLSHLALFIQRRMEEYRPVLQGVSFKDPTLNLFYLLKKLGLELKQD